MISALAWIPRGVAKSVPEPAEPSPEDLEAMRRAAEEGVELDGEGFENGSSDDDDEVSSGEGEELTEEEAGAALAHAQAVAAAVKASGGGSSTRVGGGVKSIEEAMRELNMERYDDDDDDDNEGAMARILGLQNKSALPVYVEGEDDPYLTLGGTGGADDDSEAEDLEIKPMDLLILAAKNEDDVSHLEVWLYEEGGVGGDDEDDDGEPNLYVHHDVMLPAFPLAVAWMDVDPTGRRQVANMAAVGMMEPGIEIWDLDVVESVEPVATLGGPVGGHQQQPEVEMDLDEDGDGGKKKCPSQKKKKKKSKKQRMEMKEGSHQDAVLGLSWNREYRNVLASGSADTTVKVWDVATQSCQHTLQQHRDKVQAVAWNPAEAAVLLSGGFDRQAIMTDVRSPGSKALAFSLDSDVESLSWSPHHPTQFVVSTEDGVVTAFDARNGSGSAPLYRLQAHDKAACAVGFSAAMPGVLMTASTDKKVKLWGVTDNKPTLLATQDLAVGAVFAACFCPEAPWLLVAGGSKGDAAVWDVRSSQAVRAAAGADLRRWREGGAS